MKLFYKFSSYIIFSFFLAACGGSDSDSGDNGGSSGGNNGGGNGGVPTTPVFTASFPNQIYYQQDLVVSYTTTRVDSVSVSNVSENIDVSVNESARQITIRLNSNVTGEHSFRVNYSNEYENKSRTILLTSEESHDQVENSELFCFVGYCDGEGKETFYINQAGRDVEAHFVGFTNSQLKFNYELDSSFGKIEDISFSISDFNGGSVSVDQDKNVIILDMVNASHSRDKEQVMFRITNKDGDTETVLYSIYFVRGGGGQVLLDPFYKPYVISQPGIYTIDVGLFDTNNYGDNVVIDLIRIFDPVNGYPNGVSVDIVGNSVEITITEVFYNTWFYDHIRAFPIEVLFGINDGDGNVISSNLISPINLRLITEEFAENYYQLEYEFNQLANEVVALFEIDLAILFFDNVFSLKGLEKPYDGDLKRFLSMRNNGEISELNYIKNIVGLNDGISFAYNGFDEEALDYFRNGVSRRLSGLESNRYDRELKVDLLNEYIDRYNQETDNNYAFLPTNYYNNSLSDFEAYKSYFKGNGAYGEYVGDQFVFNSEYTYLQGLADSLPLYIGLILK